MSRVGKRPIPVPAGVTVEIEGTRVAVRGPKGERRWTCPEGIAARVDGAQIHVDRAGETAALRSLHGTSRSLIANMVDGVARGFSRALEIQGVGYRAQVQGRMLVMNLGYSHAIEFEVPEGVTVTAADATHLTVSGTDKQQVGDVSARIRGFAPAEPYKGKGVRYKDEQVRRKAGKTVA